jgi:hypothetical protein
MNDNEFADEIIKRLNVLLEDPEVRTDISRLVERRVQCSEKTVNHPTIQTAQGDSGALPVFGFLGLLNGLVGVDRELYGVKEGYGYITARYNDDGDLITHFERTKNKGI